MNSLPCEYLAPSTVQDQGGKGVSSVNHNEMAHTALVPGPAQDTVRSPMAHSSVEGSPLPSEWLNFSCGPFISGSSMEPISLSLTSNSFNTALLLAHASIKRVGNMHALSVNESCMDFGSNDCKVVLKSRKGYVPKVFSTPLRAQVVTHSAFTPQ